MKSHLLDGIQVMAAEVEIPREQPIRADIRRLTAHRSQRAEMLTQRDLLRFVQFVRGYARLSYFVNDLQRQLLRGFAFLRVKCGIDAKKARIARRVGKC